MTLPPDTAALVERLGSPGWDNFGNFVPPEIKPEDHNAAIAGYSCLSMMLAKQLEGRDRRLAEAAATIEAQARRIEDAEAALRAIAEGNLGDMPWQANYARLRAYAADYLARANGARDGEGEG